ncbi:MAG: class I SAM-dependent methyltransferase [Leptospira sp.]|nr:class I SAM-dependent methyltransferase [Leptospira sp.]
MMESLHKCPLCESGDTQFFSDQPISRNYYICKNCKLISVDPNHLLDLSNQKIRYDFHENQPDNSGYMNFLNKAILPALNYINTSGIGLDYGSGPGSGPESKFGSSALAYNLIRDHNCSVQCYDPVYSPWEDSEFEMKQKYFDYIFSTEVWEHFTHPFQSIKQIHSLLKPQGILTVMTGIWNETMDFPNWYYPKDDTHVVFYHEKTMEWISGKFDWNVLERPSETVWIFQKN